jgi:hypothetical protein
MPAGAEKTTVLATWARQRAQRGGVWVAWVSLGREDNDPRLLWSAIPRALKVSGAWDTEPPGRPAPPREQVLAASIAVLEHSVAAVETVDVLLRHALGTLARPPYSNSPLQSQPPPWPACSAATSVAIAWQRVYTGRLDRLRRNYPTRNIHPTTHLVS